ncbi:MAG: hypothetical protein IPH26_17620 [Sterolibacteriaceae bacterium]|uniref:Uncharacterized protein n=1 Tax=Candidatus Methylophosphatis roskildensis TaxID=2899263 RepID=A0A9D7E1D9_9PROT|nr:hypothetical protein [Candidatus Methylophosphatis roskildensis]
MTSALMKIDPAGLPALPSVLGDKRYSCQTGGKVRPGIKVLTKAAQKIEAARRLYDEGVEAGQSFDDIEARIRAAVPNLDRSPLTPRNVPYFTVRGSDFAMPEIARQIMSKYAEDRGDGILRLYRFPVVFASDSLLDVMPHKLEAYGSGSIKFWSDFSADGSERYCMTFAPVRKASSGRAIRVFGGRKHQLREANEGRCDPENCPEYQNRQCNVKGRIIFYIPGITRVAPLELPTNSLYGLDAVRETLRQIAAMRGGRFSGFLQGQEAFWLTKKLAEVPHIDEEGRAVRVEQWIIGLEVMIDPTRLLGAPQEQILADGERAASILTGNAERIDDRTDPSFVAEKTAALVTDDDAVLSEGRDATAPVPPDGDDGDGDVGAPIERDVPAPYTQQAPVRTPQQAAPTRPASTASPRPPNGTATQATDGVAAVTAQAQGIGVDAGKYIQFAGKRWGPGWSKNPNGLKRACEELESYRGDPAALTERIDAELNVFS